MSRDEVLAKLRAHEAELWAAGVQALCLFGSVARDEASEGSDVDLLYDRAPEITLQAWGHDDLKDQMKGIVGRDVDLITRHFSYPRLRSRIEASLVSVFYWFPSHLPPT